MFIVGVIAAATAGLNGTLGTFSDTEVSTGNTLATGAIDLKIDNTSYYDGAVSTSTSWSTPKDLKPGDYFFNFRDLKPGDWGEDTISFHVNTNNSWACMYIKKTKNDDVTCNTPEQKDDPTCNEPDSDIYDGDLAQAIQIIFWADDGDNVLEQDEYSKIFKQGHIIDFTANSWWTVADKSNNVWTGGSNTPLAGGVTKYIGKAWCFGTMDLSNLPKQDGGNKGRNPTQPGMGVKCDGSHVNNKSQTDLLNLDVKFYATQQKNSPNFSCSNL